MEVGGRARLPKFSLRDWYHLHRQAMYDVLSIVEPIMGPHVLQRTFNALIFLSYK